MTKLRVGSRGSDLALWQSGWVCDRLRAIAPSIEIEQIIIKTHGDTATTQRFDANWPAGGFVGAIEQALAANEIDFAVHSFKDMQTAVTPGLIVAAIPEREVVHDVLVTREAVDLDRLPKGFKLGTSSPRRSAQFRRLGDIEIVPIRGNVPTRVGLIEGDGLDGVVLAAAGLKRLGITPAHCLDLPTDRFVPAPAQGALALQTRETGEVVELIARLDCAPTRRVVTAERSFLRGISAGCHTPVGALAKLDANDLTLHAQLFSDDGLEMVEGRETGGNAEAIGDVLAKRLLAALGGRS